jgi:hypothetical protein
MPKPLDAERPLGPDGTRPCYPWHGAHSHLDITKQDGVLIMDGRRGGLGCP